MGAASPSLLPRVEEAVDRVVQMCFALPRHAAGQEIGRQVVRSAGSVGANLEEAKATLSRREYTLKFSIALREARETLYWLRRITNNQLLPPKRLENLKNEWNEIVSIMTTTQKKLRG